MFFTESDLVRRTSVRVWVGMDNSAVIRDLWDFGVGYVGGVMCLMNVLIGRSLGDLMKIALLYSPRGGSWAGSPEKMILLFWIVLFWLIWSSVNIVWIRVRGIMEHSSIIVRS